MADQRHRAAEKEALHADLGPVLSAGLFARPSMVATSAVAANRTMQQRASTLG
jgi:hypothetical protein